MNFTAKQINKIREERECGLVHAKDILTGRWLHDEIGAATQFYHLKEVLHALVSKAFPS